MDNAGRIISNSPEETFAEGEKLGAALNGGEVILLTGGLGAGKTLFTKGVLSGIGYDVDEVTSPSFALVNLYKTERFDVFHIDLWRTDGAEDIAFSVGLAEILEDETAVVIVEWADQLGTFEFERDVFRVNIDGDGDVPREIQILIS